MESGGEVAGQQQDSRQGPRVDQQQRDLAESSIQSCLEGTGTARRLAMKVAFSVVSRSGLFNAVERRAF